MGARLGTLRTGLGTRLRSGLRSGLLLGWLLGHLLPAERRDGVEIIAKWALGLHPLVIRGYREGVRAGLA